MANDLIQRLRQASAGHVATYGDAVPNLFADALAEIEHLRKLERAAFIINADFPIKGDSYWHSEAKTLAEKVEARQEAARTMISLIRPWGGQP